MTDTQRDQIRRAIARQMAASKASVEAARASLMSTGLYNQDGTLKAAYGGPRKQAAR